MGFAGFWLIEKVFEAYLAMDVGVLVAVPWRRRWRSWPGRGLERRRAAPG